MTHSSDRIIWMLAVAGSLGIHGVFAATLVLLPKPERAKVVDTTIAFQSVPAGLPENVAARAAVRPVEAGPDVVEQSNVLKAVPEARPNEIKLGPAKAKTEEVAPIVDREIAGTPVGSVPAAVVSSERTTLDGAETTFEEATSAAPAIALQPSITDNRKLAKLPAVVPTAVAPTVRRSPAGLPKNVAARAAARPVKAEPDVIETSNVLKAVPEARPKEVKLSPAKAKTEEVAPIVDREIAGTPVGSAPAAVVSSERTALDGAETIFEEATSAAPAIALQPSITDNRKLAKLPAVVPAAAAPTVGRPAGLPENVTARAVVQPVEAELDVIEKSNVLKAVPEVQPKAAKLSPAKAKTEEVAPIVDREIAGTPADSAPAAVVSSERTALDGAETTFEEATSAAPAIALQPSIADNRKLAKLPAVVPTAVAPPVRRSPAAPSSTAERPSLEPRLPSAAATAPATDSSKTAAQSGVTQGVAVGAPKVAAPTQPQNQKVVALPPRTGNILDGSQPSATAFEQGAESKVIAAANTATRPAAESAAPPGTINEAQAAIVVPRKPAPPGPRTGEADPYGQVLEFLAGYEGDECFLALPASGMEGRVTVDGFSVLPEATARFAEELVGFTGIAVEMSGHAVSPDQCRALSFARSLATYPAPGLEIRPRARSIASGEALFGRIENLHRKLLYLLVVDDEGKVQEIKNLFQDSTGEIGFDAPMTLTRGTVDTVQLLIAVASDNPLETFASHDGQHAKPYFAALADEIVRTKIGIDFGFTFFFVR